MNESGHDTEKRRIAKATVMAAVRRILAELVPDTLRSGGPNDPREIMCDTCGDCACTYTGCVDPLDGRPATCESCGTVGKIVVGDDEGSAWVEFRGKE